MNTYNDNLRSTVLSTLGTLEQEIKKADSTTNTAMFTLYYAEGATINAKEQLDKAEAQESLRSNTKQKAVENNNLGNNALATANQANTLVQQAVTNTSVGAANVQVAANAILQLAGDMGNILNIAMAADFGSEIQVQAKTANMYISSTAYQAEQASQYAMEAAIATSGVSASTVQTTASGAAAAIGNLLSVTSTDYDTIAQVVMADNAALATYSANAKLAKGVYKDATTEQSAVKEAYVESSEQLNLGLVASTVAGKESTDFTVSFNWLTSPFPELVPTSPTQSSDPNFMPLHYPMPYPVSDYYLFMVNEAQKNTFALSDAEDIVTRLMTDRYIDLANSLKPPMDDHFSQTFSIPQLQLRDTGGVPIEAGKRYVVFVMAKYAETYKKKLNSYEDFLSAPSASFYFTNMLATANYVDDKKSATAAATDSTVADTNEAAARPKADLPPKPTSFNITVKEKVSLLVEARPDYRCIFLPVKQLPIESLPITDKPAFIFNTTIAAQVSAANYTLAQPITSPIKDLPNFSSVESARQKMEKAHKDTTDPLAGAIKSADTAAKAVVELAGAKPKAKAAEAQLTDDHTNAEGTASAASTGDAAAVKKTALEAAAAAQNEAAAVAKSAKKEANDAVGDAQKASSAAAVFAAFAETVSDVFEVFDSLSEIAAAVTADEVRSAAGKAVKGVHQANSAAATAMAAAGTDAGLLSIAKLVAAMASSLATESLYVTKTYNVTVSNATTDNFGNELHATEQYLPMILSISDEAQSALNPTYTSNMAACPEMPVTLPKA